jgi:hypothetical protein
MWSAVVALLWARKKIEKETRAGTTRRRIAQIQPGIRTDEAVFRADQVARAAADGDVFES